MPHVLKQWPADLLAKLGKVSDREWGRLAGVSHQRAAQIRTRRGVAPFGEVCRKKEEKSNEQG